MCYRRKRIAQKICTLTVVVGLTGVITLQILLEVLCGQRAGMMMACERFPNLKYWRHPDGLRRAPFRIFFDGISFCFQERECECEIEREREIDKIEAM